MKLVSLFIVLVCVFAVTTAKPVKENNEVKAKHEEKSGVEDELETSGDEDDDEEDGSTIDDEPRTREKRDAYEELEGDEKSKDSSGDDLKQGDSDDTETKDSSGDDDSEDEDDRLQKNELQWKNTMGIRGPFTITAMQPPGSQSSSRKGNKQQDQFSMNFVSPPGNIEITPFAPKINSMKKVRRRCLCPFPCGPAHEFELIGCSGPYSLPCGGFGGVWPGLGYGGYGGLYGLGGYGGYGGYGLGYPWLGGGLGYGGCGGGCGCGGCGGCGGCCGGGCCGFPMMCCK